MRFIAIVAAAGLVAGSAFGIATRPADATRPAGTEITDTQARAGTGERLLLVVAGEYPTRSLADAANARISLGDLQGFVVAPSRDFDGMAPGRWLVLTAFRTAKGATEFEDLARIAGVRALRRIVSIYRGTAWIGLGQESSPDGTGPLVRPLAPGHPDRL